MGGNVGVSSGIDEVLFQRLSLEQSCCAGWVNERSSGERAGGAERQSIEPLESPAELLRDPPTNKLTDAPGKTATSPGYYIQEAPQVSGGFRIKSAAAVCRGASSNKKNDGADGTPEPGERRGAGRGGAGVLREHAHIPDDVRGP